MKYFGIETENDRLYDYFKSSSQLFLKIIMKDMICENSYRKINYFSG